MRPYDRLQGVIMRSAVLKNAAIASERSVPYVAQIAQQFPRADSGIPIRHRFDASLTQTAIESITGNGALRCSSRQAAI